MRILAGSRPFPPHLRASMFVTDASSVTSTSWVKDDGVRPQRRGDPLPIHPDPAFGLRPCTSSPGSVSREGSDPKGMKPDNPTCSSVPLPLWERLGEGKMRGLHVFSPSQLPFLRRRTQTQLPPNSFMASSLLGFNSRTFSHSSLAFSSNPFS